MQARNLFAPKGPIATPSSAPATAATRPSSTSGACGPSGSSTSATAIPDRPHLQPNRYKDNKAIVKRLRALHEEGKLNDLQEKLLFAPTRPKEELYDLHADPHELHNLAARYLLRRHAGEAAEPPRQVDRRDRRPRAAPEPAAMYDSDMAEYLNGQKGEQGEALRKNIATHEAVGGRGEVTKTRLGA